MRVGRPQYTLDSGFGRLLSNVYRGHRSGSIEDKEHNTFIHTSILVLSKTALYEPGLRDVNGQPYTGAERFILEEEEKLPDTSDGAHLQGEQGTAGFREEIIDVLTGGLSPGHIIFLTL